jgi:cytochrome P450
MRDIQAAERTAQALRAAVDAAAQGFLDSAEAAGCGQGTRQADGAAAVVAVLLAAGAEPSADRKEGAGGGGRAQPQGSGILPRLLAQPSLSVAEAVCNALSSLLAGMETTSLVLAVSLMHLAENPQLQASTGPTAIPRSRSQPGADRPCCAGCQGTG